MIGVKVAFSFRTQRWTHSFKVPRGSRVLDLKKVMAAGDPDEASWFDLMLDGKILKDADEVVDETRFTFSYQGPPAGWKPTTAAERAANAAAQKSAETAAAKAEEAKAEAEAKQAAAAKLEAEAKAAADAEKAAAEKAAAEKAAAEKAAAEKAAAEKAAAEEAAAEEALDFFQQSLAEKAAAMEAAADEAAAEKAAAEKAAAEKAAADKAAAERAASEKAAAEKAAAEKAAAEKAAAEKAAAEKAAADKAAAEEAAAVAKDLSIDVFIDREFDIKTTVVMKQGLTIWDLKMKLASSDPTGEMKAEDISLALPYDFETFQDEEKLTERHRELELV